MSSSPRAVLFIAAVVLATLVVLAVAGSRRSETAARPSATQAAVVIASATPALAASPTPSVALSSAPSASPTTAASPSPQGERVNTTYGFKVTLPDPYRVSDRLTTTFPPGTNPLAQDAFTVRTKLEEDRLARQSCETACEIWTYVAIVEIWSYRGPASPREWYSATSGAMGETFTDMRIDGRPAVRIDKGATFPVQVVVRDGDRMFKIAYQILSGYDVPAGASQDKLERIIASFHFTT